MQQTMQTTLITGASGGIGEALATRFAERKHNLLLLARNAAKLQAQCQQLADTFGIAAQYIAADLATPAAPAEVFAEAQRRGLEVIPAALTSQRFGRRPYAAGWRANFSTAAGVSGVKRLTRLPSGSRKSSERLPQGMVVGACTSAPPSTSARRW